jgi:branched-chain amino acid aminotransferase
MKIWMNGELLDREDAKVSVFDHGLLYGDGVFEGIRMYGGRIFQCRAHMERLFLSAEIIRLDIGYSAEDLEKGIYDAAEANSLTDAYIRLVVTRGPGTLGLNPHLCSESTVFIIVDKIAMYSEEMYANGMGVIVAKTRRTHSSMMNPRVKSLNYLNNIYAKMEGLDADVPEALMLNMDGDVAEATGDNVFIVKDGTLMTPPPEAGLLLGITRCVVMHLAAVNSIPVSEQRITPDDLFAADECFLTGTGAEVIAVTSIDGKPVGSGKVGPVTKTLLDAFRKFILTDEQVDYKARI